MQVWNIEDCFGQPGQLRLTEEGKFEIKGCGQRVWRLLTIIDMSIFTVKDIQSSLRENQGVLKVTRQSQ